MAVAPCDSDGRRTTRGLSSTNSSPCVPAQVVNVSSNVSHDSISGHEIWLCNSVLISQIGLQDSSLHILSLSKFARSNS